MHPAQNDGGIHRAADLEGLAGRAALPVHADRQGAPKPGPGGLQTLLVGAVQVVR